MNNYSFLCRANVNAGECEEPSEANQIKYLMGSNAAAAGKSS